MSITMPFLTTLYQMLDQNSFSQDITKKLLGDIDMVNK